MLWTGVTLFPTFVCNFSCPFCAFSEDLNQYRDELTLAEIEQLARELKRVLVLHIGGGEPFIRKDLPEVIAAMWRHARVRKVEIPTNGWSAERIVKPVERILALCPGIRLNVRVSLDGVGERHDTVRARPGSYKAALETLESLGRLAAAAARAVHGRLPDDHVPQSERGPVHLRDDSRRDQARRLGRQCLPRRQPGRPRVSGRAAFAVRRGRRDDESGRVPGRLVELSAEPVAARRRF